MEFSGIINSKNKIVGIAIIIFALIIGYKIYKAQDRAVGLLGQKKEWEIKKNASLDNIRQFEKKINFYKNKVNKKEVSSLINTLSSITSDSEVKIISLTPLQEMGYPLYTKYPFKLAVSAGDYDVIGRFIGKLENNPDIYIVESAVLKPNVKMEMVSPAGPNDGLTLELTLYTILFK